MLDLDSDFFRNEDAARQKLEALRWAERPTCCHCGAVGTAGRIRSRSVTRRRSGLFNCANCKRQFTVTVGTILESSHIPLHKWLQVIYLLVSANGRVSIRQIQETLDITYKSAWIMVHRLRTALADGHDRRHPDFAELGRSHFARVDD
jgi:transposase-like protein